MSIFARCFNAAVKSMIPCVSVSLDASCTRRIRCCSWRSSLKWSVAATMQRAIVVGDGPMKEKMLRIGGTAW